MDDHGLVAAIVAGDSDGLTEAIDRYGPSLLADCRAVLEKPAADEVVLDTFVIARARLEGLADPAKLESWLAAVARAECARRSIGLGPRRAADAGLAIVAQPEAVPPEPVPADAETRIAFPQQLRGKILAVCTDETPTGRAERASAAHRAGPFGHDGFPRPARLPGQRGAGWRGRGGVLAVAAGVAVVAVVALTVVLLTGAGPGKAAASQNGTGQNDGPGQGLPGSSASGTGGSSGKATPKAGQAAGTPSPGATASLLQAARTSAPASPQPTGQPAPGKPGSGNPSPSPTPQQAGTLVPSTNWLSVTSVNNQEVSVSFELTAQGGPVSSYAISTSTPGRVSITPQAGSIPAGGTVVITITAHTRRTFTTPLTLAPGGGAVRLHVIAVLPGG